ncbi:MAG: amino acid permease [Holosporales bacterium]|jgi:APA family basic amino acid/polyamine antiporter|nr:amino acid permease [Holosporales bacterium]
MESQGKALGFCALVSIVISSQLGSGIFVLPSSLAKYGVIGLSGWLVSVAGAIALTLVFSDLSARLTKNGGPHAYVHEAFGPKTGFFTGWAYWMISWASNSILLVTAMKYLSTMIGEVSTCQTLIIETLLLLAITCLSIVRMNVIGRIGSCLMVLKYVPLIILPIIFLMFFDVSSFKEPAASGSVEGISSMTAIATTALLTFWGFVGVECATAATTNVRNPEKTIPRALIIGTICVAVVYILNTISIIGVTGFDRLTKTEAPYSFVMNMVFGSGGDVMISVLAIIVCLSTLNSWIFTSGQIAVCACTEKLFPSIFGRTNKHGAPIFALAFTFLGNIPFLILERLEQNGFDKLISRMCSVFMCIYLVCCLAHMKFIRQWYHEKHRRYKRYALSVFALVFCLFAMVQDMVSCIVMIAVFSAIGIPIYMKASTQAAS